MTRADRPTFLPSRIEPAMPANLPQPSLFAGLLLTFVAMCAVAAWTGIVLRLALGSRALPAWTPRVVPWGAGSVFLSMVAWFMVLMAVPAVYSVVARPKGERPKARAELSPGQIMTLSAGQNLATLIVIPLVLAATSGARLKDFGIVREGSASKVGWGLAAYPTLAPIVFGIMLVSVLYWGKTAHPLETAIAEDKTPGMGALFVLAGVVLAPMAEELIFRGVLLGWLTRFALKGKGPRPSDPFSDPEYDLDNIPPLTPISLDDPDFEPDPEFPSGGLNDFGPYAPPTTRVASMTEAGPIAVPGYRLFPLLLGNVAVSLIFAALHASVWPTPIPLFFLSLGLGLLYQRTGSLIAPIVLHMTFNGVSTLLMFLMLGALADKAPKKAPNPIPGPANVAVILREFSDLVRTH